MEAKNKTLGQQVIAIKKHNMETVKLDIAPTPRLTATNNIFGSSPISKLALIDNDDVNVPSLKINLKDVIDKAQQNREKSPWRNKLARYTTGQDTKIKKNIVAIIINNWHSRSEILCTANSQEIILLFFSSTPTWMMTANTKIHPF